MSFTEAHAYAEERPAKQRIQRRHGACEPCRSSKTRCDGRFPCGACRSEKRRQCPCVYSPKVMKLQQVAAEMRRRDDRDSPSHSTSTLQPSPQPAGKALTQHRPSGTNVSRTLKVDTNDVVLDNGSSDGRDDGEEPEDSVALLPLSLCTSLEEFKKLKSARGASAQVISRCNGFEAVDMSPCRDVPSIDNSARRVYASQHSDTMTPEEASLKKALDDVYDLVQRGRLTRAWIEIAAIIREAQNLKLSARTTSERAQKSQGQLWDDILDLECQLGLTLGQPPQLVRGQHRGSKDEPDGETLKDPSLEATRFDRYRHIHSILDTEPDNPEWSTTFKRKAQAILEHDPFNKIGLCTTEKHSQTARDLQLSIHLLFMVINCRLASMCDSQTRDGHGPVMLGDDPVTDGTRPMGNNQPRQKLVYCRKMTRSAQFVVSIFLSLFADDESAVAQNWMQCHSVFIAATVLGIAKLRHEVEWDKATDLLRQLQHAFSKLSQSNSACKLFSIAVGRLGDLNSVKEPTSEVTRHKHSGTKHRKRGAAASTETSPVSGSNINSQSFLDETDGSATSPLHVAKRSRIELESSHQLTQDLAMSFTSSVTDVENISQMTDPAASYQNPMNQMSFYEVDPSMFSRTDEYLSDPAPSTATSFCEGNPTLGAMSDLSISHPGPPFAYPFPYHIIHPPMLWHNSKLMNGDQIYVETAMGLQFFQAPPGVTADPVIQEDLNAAGHQGTNMNGTFDHTTIRSGGTDILAGQDVADASLVNQSFAMIEPSPIQRRDTLLKGDQQSRRPAVDRRHSTETIQVGPVPTATNSAGASTTWPPTSSTNDVATLAARRASSADDSERVTLQQQHEQDAAAFLLPLENHLQVPSDTAAHALFRQAQTITSVPEPRFYTSSAAAPHQTHGHGHGHRHGHVSTALGHDCAFTCHQQEGYIQGPTQWRQITVNAGVPSGS